MPSSRPTKATAHEGYGVLIAIGVGFFVGLILHFTFVRCFLRERALDPHRLSIVDNASVKDTELPSVVTGPSGQKMPVPADQLAAGSANELTPAPVKKVATNILNRDCVNEALSRNSVARAVHDNAEVLDERTEYVFTYLQGEATYNLGMQEVVQQT